MFQNGDGVVFCHLVLRSVMMKGKDEFVKHLTSSANDRVKNNE